MPQVLVDGATVMCSHSGVMSLSGGNTKFTVSNNGAITAGMEIGIDFTTASPPCQSKNPTSGAPTPCKIVAAATAGISSVLSIAGTPVLLDTAGGVTVDGTNPPGTWSVASAGQTMLSVSG
jgi:hypothetical protein